MFDCRCRLLVMVVCLLAQSWLDVDSATSMSVFEQQTLVDLHNELRRAEGSSNMQLMVWDDTLAVMAQNWSDGCSFEHGFGINSSTLYSLGLGQNLWAGTGTSIGMEGLVMNWYNEKAYFNYDTVGCSAGKVCGHYTQVVWATSNRVGCGYTICPVINHLGWRNSILMTCDYSPPGNYAGAQPYLKGPACSQCDSGKFYCNNGLCDGSCTAPSDTCQCQASCKNCAKTTSSCRCQCGVGWWGVDCSKTCRNYHDYCGANPGYNFYMCGNSFVFANCPAMCDDCVTGTPDVCTTIREPVTTPTTTTTFQTHEIPDTVVHTNETTTTTETRTRTIIIAVVIVVLLLVVIPASVVAIVLVVRAKQRRIEPPVDPQNTEKSQVPVGNSRPPPTAPQNTEDQPKPLPPQNHQDRRRLPPTAPSKPHKPQDLQDIHRPQPTQFLVNHPRPLPISPQNHQDFRGASPTEPQNIEDHPKPLPIPPPNHKDFRGALPTVPQYLEDHPKPLPIWPPNHQNLPGPTPTVPQNLENHHKPLPISPPNHQDFRGALPTVPQNLENHPKPLPIWPPNHQNLPRPPPTMPQKPWKRQNP